MKISAVLILMLVASGLLAQQMEIPANVDVDGDIKIIGANHLQIDGFSENLCISNALENTLFADENCNDVLDPEDRDLFAAAPSNEFPPEGFTVRLVADQNLVVNSSWTLLAMDNEDIDDGADFDLTADEYTAPYTGWYVFSGAATSASEVIVLGLSINNATPLPGATGTILTTTNNSSAWTVKLDAGDTASLKIWTTSQPSNVTDAGFRGVALPTGGIDQPVAGSVGDLVLDGDCAQRAGDVSGAVCVEPSGTVFTCQPTSGDCDTEEEWIISGDGPNGGDTADAYWHAWDVTTLAAAGSNLSVNPADSVPASFAFDASGMYLYVVGSTSDRINQYTLTTAFDLSTASATASCCAAFDTTPSGVFIDASGTHLYTTGQGSDTIRSYTLSTPFDITTASFVTSVSGGANPKQLYVSPDGTHIVSLANAVVRKQTMSTPWDLSTMSFDYSVTPPTSELGMYMSPDGEQLLLLAAGIVYKYNLTAPWNVASLPLHSTFNYGAGVYSQISGSPDGQRNFILETNTDTIRSYNMGFAVDRNVGIDVPVPLRALHVADRGMRINPRASSLTSPAAGDIYTDSTLGRLGYYDGTRWVYHGAMVDQITSTATCTNNAVGASLQALTVTPSTSVVLVTNSDPDGCNVTMSETGAVSGRSVELVVVSNAGGAVNFADTSGVTEISAAFAADLWDSITLRYVTDRWVQENRSDN